MSTGTRERVDLADGVFLRDSDGAVTALRGGRCTACGHLQFPAADQCQACRGRSLTDEALAATGTLLCATTVHLPAAGLTAPYSVGYIDLDDGVRLFAPVDSGGGPLPAPGARVRVRPATVRVEHRRDAEGTETEVEVLAWVCEPHLTGEDQP